MVLPPLTSLSGGEDVGSKPIECVEITNKKKCNVGLGLKLHLDS